MEEVNSREIAGTVSDSAMSMLCVCVQSGPRLATSSRNVGTAADKAARLGPNLNKMPHMKGMKSMRSYRQASPEREREGRRKEDGVDQVAELEASA